MPKNKKLRADSHMQRVGPLGEISIRTTGNVTVRRVH